nr:Zinc finger domain containing protein [Haemonchus contortus]
MMSTTNFAATHKESNPLDIWMSSSLGERLSCSICCEIFYKAANVIPCGHNFCLSCIMRFMATKADAECPQCRERITDIGMAYTVNSIVTRKRSRSMHTLDFVVNALQIFH